MGSSFHISRLARFEASLLNDRLFYQHDIVRSPRLVEPRFERAVESQGGVPTLAGDGLNPVAFLAGWRLRAEPDIHRTIGIHQQAFGLAAHRRPVLVGLEHRAGLAVVNNHGPEIFDRMFGGPREY